jgi:hypothetical protein
MLFKLLLALGLLALAACAGQPASTTASTTNKPLALESSGGGSY